MNPSSNHPGRRTDQQRLNAVGKVLLWVGVIVLALIPVPWW